MSQSQRNRKQIASTVDPELWEMFRELSVKTRIPASLFCARRGELS